jgi:hypothetical protein
MKSFTNARAFIYWENMWRHVHVLRSYDQMKLEGGSEKMLEFKLSKGTKISYSAPLTSFHKTRPKSYKPKVDGLA